MSNTSFLKRRWKLLLNIATILALVVLAYAIRHQLNATLKNLTKVNAAFLLLIIPIEAWNYYSQTKLFQKLFSMLGIKLNFRPLLRLVLELNFVNNVFPSGGVSGVSYFAARSRSSEISVGRATFAYIMKMASLFFSFEILTFLGLIMLAVGGHVNNVVILASSTFTTLLIVGTFLFIFVIGSQRRVHATLSLIGDITNTIVRTIWRDKSRVVDLEKLHRLLNEFHENYNLFKSNQKQLLAPLGYGLLCNLSELSAIYVVYLAFGHLINPGAIILAYAVANFAGLVSVIPGGVGTYEAIMTAVLVASGVPAKLSLPVTIMYRVVNTLIQLPPGYYFYHKTLHSNTSSAVNVTD